MEDRERWKEVDRRMFSVLGSPGGSRRSRQDQGSGSQARGGVLVLGIILGSWLGPFKSQL